MEVQQMNQTLDSTSLTTSSHMNHTELKRNGEKEEIIVYLMIQGGKWISQFSYQGEIFVVEGTETQEDQNRNEIQATLEVLQFLRNWITTNVSFTIYTNSQYCITCYYKWIPQWITKGFRIGHTGKMRPNSDLLVKLHMFGTCMDFDLVQHYDAYETYQRVFL